MPRTLPWKSEAVPRAVPGPSRTPAARGNVTPRRRRPAGADDEGDLNATGVTTPQRRARLHPARSPSTSPPPTPPEQEPMRDGYAADDIYRMVEDEFLSTAQLYTQYLHHAEYQRLKRLAREREAHRAADGQAPGMFLGTVSTRPVSARPNRPRRADSDDTDDNDDLIVGDAHLAGLLDSPRKQQLLMRREGTVTMTGLCEHETSAGDAATVATDGSKSRMSNPTAIASDPDTDYDDLDVPYQRPPVNDKARVASEKVTAPASDTHLSIMAKYAKKSIKERETTLRQNSPPKHERSSAADDKDENTAQRTRSHNSTLAKWRERSRRKAEKEAASNEVTFDEIPTFMI